MALTITVWQFSKRERSTAIPAVQGPDINVNLKGGCDMMNPVFTLDNTGLSPFNYVLMQSRYYFVTGIRSVTESIIEVSCRVDVLGSWKSAITGTTAMVLYASGGRNDIVDQRIPIDQSVTVTSSPANITGFTITDSNQGSIILSITGKGSFGNYLMQDPTRLPNLMDGVDNYWTAQNVVTVGDAAKQFFFGGSAGECIKSAISIPIIPPATWYSGTPVEIVLGSYPTQEDAYKLTSPTFTGTATVSIPWTNSGWQKHAPYTQLFLYVPLAGVVTLPTDELINESNIYVLYAINGFSGDFSVEIRAGSASGRIISNLNGNCATATPYGSAAPDTGKITQGIVAGIGGAAVGIATIASGGSAAVAAGAIGGSLSSVASGFLAG